VALQRLTECFDVRIWTGADAKRARECDLEISLEKKRLCVARDECVTRMFALCCGVRGDLGRRPIGLSYYFERVFMAQEESMTRLLWHVGGEHGDFGQRVIGRWYGAGERWEILFQQAREVVMADQIDCIDEIEPAWSVYMEEAELVIAGKNYVSFCRCRADVSTKVRVHLHCRSFVFPADVFDLIFSF